MIELEPPVYGTHSLRRAKVALIYQKTATCAHANFCWDPEAWEPVRYLGIEVDDALEMSEQIDL